MSKQEELKDRFYKFALAVIRLFRKLPKEMTSTELGRQVLKSSTSIAANYEEATAGFSKADFIHKLSISFKESKETHLWLRLLRDSGLVSEKSKVANLIKESEAISNILGRSLITSKSNLKRKS